MRSIAAHVLDTWPGRLERWPKRTVLVVAAIVAFTVVLTTLIVAFRLSEAQAIGLALISGGAVLLVQRLPFAAWAVSLAGVAVASLWANAELWVDPMLNSHFVVLGLAAFRTSARAAAVSWGATIATGAALALYLRPVDWPVGLIAATVVSGLLLTTVVAVRALISTSQSLRSQRAAAEAQHQRTVRLEERARIARELHDVVAHHMSVIAIQAEAAQYRDSGLAPQTAASLDTIRSSATAALGEMRRILDVLRSGDTGVLPQPTLADVPDLVASVRATGARVALELLGDTSEVPASVELSAFRIVQEAVSNAIRHAPGAPVRIQIAATPAEIRISVENQHMPPVPTTTGSGHGILGMRERVAMLGGTLDIGPTGDGKYRVAAALPTQNGDR
ncbi:sensor histidine kinase [Nocardia goodfellowii]|uniref:histidine kinase n=1 Tax=Nocardia goodfellowii TaxID=882446 RepID=A0ABS4QDX0_9NOCA|nr:histidine kinase [Nocardia goodfellowii]MBP2189867.1 signal transduction histidine kinase [Nocardia goodfellowii]